MNSLVLYNTQSRKKEVFEPIDPKRITMYVCGPTVYYFSHIGNARPVVAFDVLFRVLRSLYDDVVYASNITDIDDKIMTAAREEGTDIATISKRYTEAYSEDMAALGNLKPSMTPYATEHLPQMIHLMETMIKNGCAYVADEHVLFSVEALKDYGKLSNRNLEDMLAGARVEVAGYKKHPGDFVLWKPSKEEDPGWDSPWGRGRPGWHTECVAMIDELLGPSIDIHGGGRDLIFPHHENELAQSMCAHPDHTFCRYWMHNGYVNMDGEKMSKSLGNFKTVRDLLDNYRGEVLRFALLSAHYRSELAFSKDLLDQSKASLDSLYTALRDSKDIVAAAGVSIKDSAFHDALMDDLNTPMAISELHRIAKDLNKAGDADKATLKAELLASAELIGLLNENPEQWFRSSADSSAISEADIEALIQARVDAKNAKQYQRADEIREELKNAGVVLEDSREGTTWRRS
ncbi:cysteine--tRNA ligase [Aurantivibrio infirmus]